MPNLNRLETSLTQNLNMNKSRITCLSLMIIAIITAQSSNLKKIAGTLPTAQQMTATTEEYNAFSPKHP